MADLIIGGETFRVEVEGDPTRPAVLLAHSLGVDLSMWDPQLPSLTKHFRVIRYDARGHGGTDLGGGPVSIDQLGQDALAILDALELETAHFVGLSMGGAVGLWLLAHAPERIERAVLANTAPKLGTPDVWNARITAVLSRGMAETAQSTIERWFTPGFAGAHPDVVGPIRAQIERIAPAHYAACCAALRDMDLRACLPNIPHDVLVISGREDPVVPPEDAAAFAAQLPGGRHATLDSRHLSNVEAAAAFDTAVTSFLTSRTKPRVAGRKPVARRPAPTKIAPAKRPAVSRRATAARLPLKESVRTPVKTVRAPAKKTPVASKAPETKPLAPARKTRMAAKAATKKLAAKKAAGRRGSAKGAIVKATSAKAVSAKTSAGKSIGKTSVGKTSVGRTLGVKSAPRKGAVKKAAVKKAAAKTTTRRPAPLLRVRGPVAKAAATKTRPAKTPAKAAAKKTAVKKASRKVPASRRKPTTKPRRPSGRRKT